MVLMVMRMERWVILVLNWNATDAVSHCSFELPETKEGCWRVFSILYREIYKTKKEMGYFNGLSKHTFKSNMHTFKSMVEKRFIPHIVNER